MASIRVSLTLVLALMLGLAVPVTAQSLSGPEFIDLTPCRILDTRSGAPLPGGMVRDVQITGVCNVPTNVPVTAAALNFTIVTPTAAGHLTVFPKNGVVPLASLVNYLAGETIANAVDIGLGTGGQISVQPLTTTHLVIDVYGYFTDVEELTGQNTALGAGALSSNTTGFNNTALGFIALLSNTEGANNTATGVAALGSNTTGGGNTATGVSALVNNTTGNRNIALGATAGANVTTGNDNIHIGNVGVDTDTGLIRIGTAGTQTATFIAGINGVNIGMGATVFVNANGQLGTTMSAAGFKEGIEDLGEGSHRLLGLRPVRFRYKPQHDDPSRPMQYGLVAEEVAAVFPELVYPGPDGAPYSVRYHLLSVLLLNELQRQEREWRAEKVEAAARFEAQQAQLDEMRAQVHALIGGRPAIRE